MSNSLFLISLLVDLIQVSLPPPPQHLLSICFWHKWVQYTRKCLWKKSLHSLCLVYLVNTVIPYISFSRLHPFSTIYVRKLKLWKMHSRKFNTFLQIKNILALMWILWKFILIDSKDDLKNLLHTFKIHQISILLLLCTFWNNISKCLFQ